MTRSLHPRAMRPARVLPMLFVLLAAAAPAPAQEALPADVAAAAPDGKWTIRKRELYAYLARYYGQTGEAKPVLPDLVQRTFVQYEAGVLKVVVTDQDVSRWLQDLDGLIREKSGGATDLAGYMKEQGMAMTDLRRRARVAILRERVARARICEKDPTRPKDKALPEDTVTLVIDDLLTRAKVEYDRAKLPAGVIARVNGVEINEYEYGRELSYALPSTEVARALNGLVLVEETKVLLGNDDPPSDIDLAIQKKWFMDYERNRIARQMKGRQAVTDDMVVQSLEARGLTQALAFGNPSFLAQARARGHFRRTIDQDTLRRYYDDHKERYGDELKVARILVSARAQQVAIAGKKVRTLEQGKALADALYVRATEGSEFAKLAAENSDDPDVIRLNGGVVPMMLTATMPGYEETWAQANRLKANEISKPFFSQGRGYVIVKLLERKVALGFDAQAHDILQDAAEEMYRSWMDKGIQSALRSKSLLDE